jgi:hypothetical protein
MPGLVWWIFAVRFLHKPPWDQFVYKMISLKGMLMLFKCSW